MFSANFFLNFYPMSTIENQLERLVGMVSSLATVTEQNTRDISRLETSVERLANVSTIHQQNLEQHQRNFEIAMDELRRQGVDIREMQIDVREMQIDVREMQAEVRGLQTENRRILDQIINKEET